ncbi:Pancreatic lipase-related protein 2, partial [Stegodyphus mimosarum]
MKVALYLCFSIIIKLVDSNSTEYATTDKFIDYFGAPEDQPNPQHAFIGSKKCMTVLGCFVLTADFFHPLYRPINFLPQDRATIDTQFLLYTKENPKELQKLDVSKPESIKTSYLNPKRQTAFIVHGFFDSRLYAKWMEATKDDILLHGDYNVIIVDWSKGNGMPYTQAAANTRVVGAEIALMIQTLQKLEGLSPMDCHIIGHSLGAHIGGYAGKRLNKLGRITAADPAQPYFQNMPASVRLDRRDADFVDVIHTDVSSLKFLALGMSQAVGHVDFYPNNGMSQPGCATSVIYSIFMEGLFDAARRFVSCNHQRAVDFFTYSINYKKILPVAHECRSWSDYLGGLCSDCGPDGRKCAILGFRADEYRQRKNDSQSIKMYLATSGSAPFFLNGFQITVKLQKPKKEYKDRNGQITLTIFGEEKDFEVTLKKYGTLTHGATYPYLAHTDSSIGKVKGVSFTWRSSEWSSLFLTQTIHLDYLKLVPMNVVDEKKKA